MFEQLSELNNANYNLSLAIQKNDLNEVKKQLDIGASPDYKQLENSVLLLSCADQKWEIVEELLNRGANVYTHNNFNVNCLHFVCQFAPIELVQKFVSLGCPIDQKDGFDETPLMKAVRANRKDVVDFLLEDFYVNVKINSQNENKETVLHIAAKNNNKDMFLQLWYQGADISLVDKDNKNPVSYIQDDDWRNDLIDFEKIKTKNEFKQEKEEEVKQENDIENTSEEEIKQVSTLKLLGISSIKRRNSP